MKKIIKYIPACFLFLWMGCSDDNEHLVATTTPEFKYELPQGDHDYDGKIVDWYNRCGFYILYKFEPKDVYFNGSSLWGESYLHDTINGGHLGSFNVMEANEIYVDKQLKMLEELFLNFYPDPLLKSFMPKLVFLGRELKEVNALTTKLDEVLYRRGYYSLIIGCGDETIESLLASAKRTLKTDLSKWFLHSRLYTLGEISASEEFFSVTDYYWKGDASKVPTNNQCYGLGIIYRHTSTVIETIKRNDYQYYINMIISSSYETLTAEPANGNYNSTNYTGILHPKKDVNGLIRRKYDLIIRDYLAIGIDLQAIGNYQPQ